LPGRGYATGYIRYVNDYWAYWTNSSWYLI